MFFWNVELPVARMKDIDPLPDQVFQLIRNSCGRPKSYATPLSDGICTIDTTAGTPASGFKSCLPSLPKIALVNHPLSAH
jgi:hypothetical protein